MADQTENMNEITQSLSKISRDYRIAMTELNDAAKRREQFSLRAEQRISFWTRLSMGGLILLVILLLLLVLVLSNHLKTISGEMVLLNQNFNQVLQHIGGELPAAQDDKGDQANDIHSSIRNTTLSLGVIQNELKTMNGNLAKMAKEMKAVANNTAKKDEDGADEREDDSRSRYGYPYGYPYR